VHPVLWSGLGLTVPTYGALLVAGFLGGVLLVRRRAPALGLDPDRMTTVAAQLAIAGTAGSRLWFVLAEPAPYLAQPWRLLAVWEGGHVWYGAVAGGLGALLWHARHTADLRTLGDLYLPAASFGHLCGRLGCFAAGCCWGRPTDLPWGVVFPETSLCREPNVPLHPTQLYEAGGEALILLVLLAVWRRHRTAGEVGLAYLTLYPLLRLALEPLRGDVASVTRAGISLTPAQLASLALLLGAAAAWGRLRRTAADAPRGTSRVRPR
jgi:phosphatidylglycerol:prolipoprotein diacylglycerol transferase